MTVWLPTLRLVIGSRAATPPARVRGAPTSLPSIENCTVPVGVPPAEARAAEKVTAWPKRLGLTVEVTVVVVG